MYLKMCMNLIFFHTFLHTKANPFQILLVSFTNAIESPLCSSSSPAAHCPQPQHPFAQISSVNNPSWLWHRT